MFVNVCVEWGGGGGGCRKRETDNISDTCSHILMSHGARMNGSYDRYVRTHTYNSISTRTRTQTTRQMYGHINTHRYTDAHGQPAGGEKKGKCTGMYTSK